MQIGCTRYVTLHWHQIVRSMVTRRFASKQYWLRTVLVSTASSSVSSQMYHLLFFCCTSHHISFRGLLLLN